jgi:uncharacterized protein involved in response to NO
VTPALWSSGFRPFFLAGAAYGPLALAAWMLAWAGMFGAGTGPAPLHLWHAHEMLFGFAAAFVCGFVLTALPSWAGTPEIADGRLMLLTAAWGAGRIASWGAASLPPGVVACLDLALFPLLAAVLLPGLLDAARKRYLALLVVLAGLTACNVLYHFALGQGDLARAEQALLLALNVLLVLFAVVAGVLIPAFTETALQEMGRDETIAFRAPLEAAAIVVAVLFAASGGPWTSAWLSGAIAWIAAGVHLARLLRWRTAAIAARPLVLAMHGGYAWLVAAMALRGLADLFGAVPPDAWIHAFSVGALGLMQLALLDRVVLRHTGRTLSISPAARAGLGLMLLAGVVRVVSSVSGSPGLMVISAMAWAAPFALFLLTDGPKLWRPSLPRQTP